MLRVLFCLILIHVSSAVLAEETAQYVSMEQLINTIDDVNKASESQVPCPQSEVVAIIPTSTKPPVPETKEVEAISGEKLSISVLSEADAQALFDRLKRQRIGLNVQCLCRARAQAMTRMMEAEGISSGKLFVDPFMSILNWKIKPNIPGNEDGKLEWKYHVAPFIYVRKGDTVEQYVLDPGLFTGPVTVAQWKSVLGNAQEPAISSRYNYDTRHVFNKPSGYIPSEVQEASHLLELGRCD